VPFHGCSNDNIGGRGRLRRREIVLQKEKTSVVNTIYDTDEQFIAGVVDIVAPVNNLSPVSLIPVRNIQKAQNLSPVSTTPPKTVQQCQRHRR
jgi:hypothetical protein